MPETPQSTNGSRVAANRNGGPRPREKRPARHRWHDWRHRALLIAMICLIHPLQWALANEPAPSDGPNDAPAAADAQGENPADRLSGFARLLRIGQTSRDIVIPAVERGSMTSMTRAAALTRRSEDYLDLIELVIQFYNADGEKDARLVTPHAEFHLPTGILISDHRTVISRSDFDLAGDRFAFDTNSRRGRFDGNVTMVIHSMDRFRSEDPGPVPEQPVPDASQPDSNPQEPESAEPEAARAEDPEPVEPPNS